ncbi:uncharacterized protein AKAME5_000875600 [Lates japonicus]|uniref:Uncharacterized protein n=1 Tax=Lates japonicus TaxID=270547 RepID=A0AAD3MMU3_LATJO|nr:uncharacterized protein AKAME5_000875600 [Lates japonicus]
MFAIADISSCQVEGRKSTRILRDLATKISEQCSASGHQQLSSFTISLKIDSDNQAEQPGVHLKPYLIHVTPEKINSYLSEFHGSCIQVLKGLLANLLALSFPESFSMMTGPQGLSLPSLESAASDILDIVVNSVKEEVKVPTEMTQDKGQREESQEKLTTATKMIRQQSVRTHSQSRVQVITGAVRTLLQQVDVCRGNRDRSSLIKLEDLISEDKLSSLCQLLTTSLGPLWSGPISPAEQVRLFCTATMKQSPE